VFECLLTRNPSFRSRFKRTNLTPFTSPYMSPTPEDDPTRGIKVFIDRGGTFTDCCGLLPIKPSGYRTVVIKLLSVDPQNYPDAPREGIRRICELLRTFPLVSKTGYGKAPVSRKARNQWCLGIFFWHCYLNCQYWAMNLTNSNLTICAAPFLQWSWLLGSLTLVINLLILLE
jgi:hypothetical protein